LRLQYRCSDPADRLTWSPGDAAQCDLWFPPGRIPLEDGSAPLLPVLVITAAQQVIVGAVLSQHPVDRTLLHPVLNTCRQQLAQVGIRPKLRTVLADSGYVSEENFARADGDGRRLLAPLAKDPGRRHHRTPKRARNLDRLPATARAHGACAIPAAGTTTNSAPAPWNQCSGNSRPARN
jgi:hypothetical protein